MSVICCEHKHKKCSPKVPIEKATIIKNYGLFGDVHEKKDSQRRINLLDFDKVKTSINIVELGAFTENVTMRIRA